MNKLLIAAASSALAVFLWAQADSSIATKAEAPELRPGPTEGTTAGPDTREPHVAEFAVEPNPKVADEPVTLKTSTPVKQNLNSKYDYALTIPAIGVNAGIRGMGLASDGKMAVPANFTEVGWYNLGTRPGDVGNAVLGAHVDNGLPAETGGSIRGVFKNLRDLKISDEILLTDQNGEELRFKITERKIYPHNMADTREVFGSNGKPRLLLITCHGAFMPSLKTYDQRLVIFTEPVER